MKPLCTNQRMSLEFQLRSTEGEGLGVGKGTHQGRSQRGGNHCDCSQGS